MITKTSLKHPTVRRKLRLAMREAVDKYNASRGTVCGGVSVIDGDIGLCFYMPHHKGQGTVNQHGFSFETFAYRGKKQDFTAAVFGGAA